MPIIIACLSQKGGVGKSTLARLIARTYAAGGWDVKIADFNTKQGTSADWVAVRDREAVEPKIAAELYHQPSALRRETADLVVVDGKPDSDKTSLEVALQATLCVIPTGLTLDDLKPQFLFARELIEKGVDHKRILFVLNKTGDSDLALDEARAYLSQSGLDIAENDLTHKIGYQYAQNLGRAVSESKYPSLNDKADALAANIVDRVNILTGAEAA
jgi:chromosome partitioning protein